MVSSVLHPHLLHPYQLLTAACSASVEMGLFFHWVRTMVGSMLSLMRYFCLIFPKCSLSARDHLRKENSYKMRIPLDAPGANLPRVYINEVNAHFCKRQERFSFLQDQEQFSSLNSRMCIQKLPGGSSKTGKK